MQFTFAPDELSLLGDFLLVVVLFALPVGLPLLLWLRRGPRNPRDVLLAVARAPAGIIRRCVDFIAWLIPAVSIVGLQLLGMMAFCALLSLLVRYGSLDADESSWWLTAPTLSAGILMLAWMRLARGPRAARDVLHIGAQQSARHTR